jgi:hypothetical protein
VARHRSFAGSGRSSGGGIPDLSLLEGVVAPRILDAMLVASAQLRKAGIRHALIGGLAVGAHGYPRATKDVVFLVGDEAFKYHVGGIVTINPAVPISVGDVAVDPVSIQANERYLERAIVAASVSGGVPVLPIEALVYLKLKSPRRKDSTDIVELVKLGLPVDRVTKYLASHAPGLLDKFDDLVVVAKSEEE